jgi:hypothetical protein
MKKVKIFFWLLLLVVLGVVVFQNKAFFMTRHSFRIDPWVAGPYVTPELPIVVIFAALFLLGLLISYFYSLYGLFKQNKTIKHLSATVAAQTAEIEALRRKVTALEGPAARPAGATPAPSVVDA